MKVLVAEVMHPAGVQLLETNNVQLVYPTNEFNDEDIEGIIVRSVYTIDSEHSEKFTNLRFVAKLGTGLDNIDLEYCRQRDIEVYNAPGVNAVSTAEFIVLQILNIYKNNFAITDAVKNKDYRRKLYFGQELSNKQVGLIGYGSVGKNVAEMIAPFVERVNIFARTQTCELHVHNLHFATQIEDVLSESDVIVLAVNLQGNERMINQEFLARLKSNVVIVNMARGGLVDEEYLYTFLKNNEQVVYCCDVFTQEPDYTLPPEQQNYQNDLLALPNVIFTPHIAGMTEECQRKIAETIAQKVLDFNKVDMK